MNEYLSKEFIEKILNAHMLDSNGAEHYAYSTLKREFMAAPGTSINRGYWKETDYCDVHRCSCCNKPSSTYHGMHNYCPRCGAQMDIQ